MSSQFNIKKMPERSEQQLKDLHEWCGYTQTQIVLIAVENLWKEVKKERESKMQQDQYEVRVIRGNRGEFVAWKGSDEQLSKEQYDLWKQQDNIEKVGRFVNGNYAEPPYIRTRGDR